MELPFEYGELVKQAQFINRKEERKRLAQNLKGGLNTMLISPRRWGKSSLVKQVALDIESRNTRFCFIDLYQIESEAEFYQVLSREVIKTTSSKMEEWVKVAKMFLGKLRPNFSFGVDPLNDFEISLDYSQLEVAYQEVLDLPEKIAKEKNIRIVICVDEFQNLAKFNNPLLFQQRLRSSWQHHKHVSYCLYGSKQHMMMDIFQNKQMPFYKFGDIMFLEKIKTEHWIPFICKQFEATKKTIDVNHAEKIVSTVKNQSYYVQQLSHLVWVRTTKKVTKGIFALGVSDLLKQSNMFFSREMELLSTTQIRFLKALSNGVENFHRKEILKEYNLGSSSNVTRIKGALEKKEIIDTLAPKIEFLDPVFERWFTTKYLIK